MLNTTGQEVRCNGYLKGENGFNEPILPIVHVVTCVEIKGQDPILIVMNQSCYYNEEEQDESLYLPLQAIITFDLTPNGQKNSNGEVDTQRMIIANREIPLQFDGRKMFLDIQRPLEEDLHILELYELTSPLEFAPEKDEDILQRRNTSSKITKLTPGNISLDEWRKRLALAPEKVVRKTFAFTTQMSMLLEAKNHAITWRHFASRFPFLNEKRINDTFHSDTFFSSVPTHKGETCSQLFIGRKTDYMSVHPLRTESHNHIALQDFGRNIGIPNRIKTDNAKSEIGSKWVDWCCKYCVHQSYTKPKSPWQNYAEQGIGDLGRMVARCMRAFQAPLSRHGWCQLWCKDVHNHLASRKLDWQTPTERLIGNIPNISVFRFHFWQLVEFYDHDVKQPGDGWLPGRFLGIAWDSGDSMTYYIKTEKPPRSGRNTILIRSTVRPRQTNLSRPLTASSGETLMENDPHQYSSLITSTNKDTTEATTNNPDHLLTSDNIDKHSKSPETQEPDLAPDDAAIADE